MTWKQISNLNPLDDKDAFAIPVDKSCNCCGRPMEIKRSSFKDYWVSTIVPDSKTEIIRNHVACNFCYVNNHGHDTWHGVAFDEDTSKWVDLFKLLDKIEWKNLLKSENS